MLRLDTPRGKFVRSGAPPLLLMLWAEGEATGTRWGAVLWEKGGSSGPEEPPAKHLAPRWEQGRKRLGQGSHHRGHRRRGVTAEDTGQEDI